MHYDQQVTINHNQSTNTQMKTKCHKLKPGHYWAAVDNRGRQIWGDTIRRNVDRAAKGLFKIIQLPKD